MEVMDPAIGEHGDIHVSMFQPTPPIDKSRLILLKPHKAQADIWEHFCVYGMMEESNEENDSYVNREALEARIRRLAVCNYCSVEINRGSSLSTTPLWNHFKKKHCELYEEAKGGLLQSRGVSHSNIAPNADATNVDIAVLSGHGVRDTVVNAHHPALNHPSSKKVCRRGSRCAWNLDQTQALVGEAIKMHVWAVPHGHTEEGWDNLAAEISKAAPFVTCGGIKGLGAKRKYKELISAYKETSDGKNGRPLILEGAVLRELLEKSRAVNDPTQNVEATINNIVLGIQTCVKGREIQKLRRKCFSGAMKAEMSNMGAWGLSNNPNNVWPQNQPLMYPGVVPPDTVPRGYGGIGITEVREGGGGTAPPAASAASLSVLADMVKRLRDDMIEENKKVEVMLDRMGDKLNAITQKLGR